MFLRVNNWFTQDGILQLLTTKDGRATNLQGPLEGLWLGGIKHRTTRAGEIEECGDHNSESETLQQRTLLSRRVNALQDCWLAHDCTGITSSRAHLTTHSTAQCLSLPPFRELPKASENLREPSSGTLGLSNSGTPELSRILTNSRELSRTLTNSHELSLTNSLSRTLSHELSLTNSLSRTLSHEL